MPLRLDINTCWGSILPLRHASLGWISQYLASHLHTPGPHLSTIYPTLHRPWLTTGCVWEESSPYFSCYLDWREYLPTTNTIQNRKDVNIYLQVQWFQHTNTPELLPGRLGRKIRSSMHKAPSWGICESCQQGSVDLLCEILIWCWRWCSQTSETSLHVQLSSVGITWTLNVNFKSSVGVVLSLIWGTWSGQYKLCKYLIQYNFLIFSLYN